MTAGTARTARRPRTWAISGWAATARPITGWSLSPRCGLTSASTTRCTRAVHAGPALREGKNDPAFRTKLQIGADLAAQAKAAGFVFRAVAADSAYGDQDGFRGELREAGLPFVMALKPRRGTWAYGADVHTPVDAARALAWHGPEDPGDWHPVTAPSATGTPRPGGPLMQHWAGGDRMAPPAWWWPPPTRPPSRRRPPGTWPPTCPAPAARARPPAPTRRRPGRDRAALRDPALDRAGLQAGQRRAGLGRLPGPLRHRHPPPPGPGQLRVLLLLGRLVPRSSRVARGDGRTAAGAGPRREGGRPPPYRRRPVLAAGAASGTRRSSSVRAGLSQRARIVLLAADGVGTQRSPGRSGCPGRRCSAGGGATRPRASRAWTTRTARGVRARSTAGRWSPRR